MSVISNELLRSFAVVAVGAQGPQGAKGEKGQGGAEISGVKYIRWGRTACPSGAQVVNKGKRMRTIL